MDEHLLKLGFSAPAILARDEAKGLLLLEDFGDATFARLLDDGSEPEKLFTPATDVLIALHQHPQAIPQGLRAYHPEKMLEDIELFLDWCTPGISEMGREEFRTAWREVLPMAHRVPASLLLRDYHVANLMLLPDRIGVQQAGLLDFQDAYQRSDHLRPGVVARRRAARCAGGVAGKNDGALSRAIPGARPEPF